MMSRLAPFLALGMMGAAYAASAQPAMIDPPPTPPLSSGQGEMRPPVAEHKEVPELRPRNDTPTVEPVRAEGRDVKKELPADRVERREDRKEMKEERKEPREPKREHRKPPHPERPDGPPPPYDGGPDGNPGWQRPADAPPPPPPPQGGPERRP